MNIKDRLLQTFRDEDYRREYVDGLADAFLATQIQVLREQRGWSQDQLAEFSGLGQSQISKFEDVNNSSYQGRTLKKIAKAFDLRLVVKFESFGTALGEVDMMNRQELERPSFKDDPAFGGNGPSRNAVTKLIEDTARLIPDSRSRFSGKGLPDVA